MNQEKLNIAVAGGGSWGTALAQTLAEKGHKVSIILRDSALANTINNTHENPRYLEGYQLNSNIYATSNVSELAEKDIVVLAVPTQQLRGFLQSAKEHFSSNAILVNTAKGFEVQSGKTMQHVVLDVLGDKNPQYAMLSGPSFAVDVMKKLPTAVVLACLAPDLGRYLRDVFSTEYFRCYSTDDVLGVEIGGAFKNIIAIAAGACDGLGFGHNTRAALITRSLAEMGRIGISLGGQESTFMGLSGVGDLILTCTGDLSRNRQVGMRLGKGESLDYILNTLGMVAEGVKTTEAMYNITKQSKINAPIISSIYDVLYNDKNIKEAVLSLMTRSLKQE